MHMILPLARCIVIVTRFAFMGMTAGAGRGRRQEIEVDPMGKEKTLILEASFFAL